MGWNTGHAVRSGILLLALAHLGGIAPAQAQDDARMRQLRLLCAQLSGDLTDPGGIAAFRRCLTTHDPLGEIKRDNGIGGGGPPVVSDRPGAKPPAGFGRDTRRFLADGVQRFATRDGRIFFALARDGKLWRWDSGSKTSAAVADKVADVVLIDDTNRFILGTDGRLSRQRDNPPNETPVDDSVASFQAEQALVYVRGKDGKLWREDGHNRALIDQQVAAFQAIDANVVYVLGTDGKLWRENGDARDRNMIASNIAAFQYVPDGDTTLVLARDGVLWRQDGKSGKSEQVDHDVAAFQALDMNLAYVLGRDGRLWRELGNRQQAELVDGGVLVGAGRAAFLTTDAQHVFMLTSDRKLWAETMPGGR